MAEPFFCFRRSLRTCIRLYQQKDKAVIAEEFNSYMKKNGSWGGCQGYLKLCVCYFGEFLQVMAEEERWDDIIPYWQFTLRMPEFQWEASARFISLCALLHAEVTGRASRQIPGIRENVYLRLLEQEKENYDQMVRLLTREELD